MVFPVNYDWTRVASGISNALYFCQDIGKIDYTDRSCKKTKGKAKLILSIGNFAHSIEQDYIGGGTHKIVRRVQMKMGPICPLVIRSVFKKIDVID